MNRRLSIVAVTATLSVLGAVTAGAQSTNYDYWGQSEVRIAASYINRDTGAVTENTNIRVPSNCRTPDRFDENQTVSPAGSTVNNVHNDACLLDSRGNKVDDGATYESYGVGNISACPDPDNAGRRTAVLDAGPTGVPATRCRQSGFQQKGIAGDKEFHARLNSTVAGTQTVIWCYDEDLNGCFDDNIQDTIVIQWKNP